MSTKKKKFKPVITRVKLNPEQAVLNCGCFNRGYLRDGVTRLNGTNSVCTVRSLASANNWYTTSGSIS